MVYNWNEIVIIGVALRVPDGRGESDARGGGRGRDLVRVRRRGAKGRFLPKLKINLRFLGK